MKAFLRRLFVVAFEDPLHVTVAAGTRQRVFKPVIVDARPAPIYNHGNGYISIERALRHPLYIHDSETIAQYNKQKGK